MADEKNLLMEQLRLLIDKGLQFGDCAAEFAGRQDPKKQTYASYARDELGDEGELEFDELSTVVCIAPEASGAYVLAWQWVSQDSVDAHKGGAGWRGVVDDEAGDQAPAPGM